MKKPKVPIVYKGKFPDNFVNNVSGWSFSKEIIKRNKGKLLTLDIDFGNVCSLNCPHCFRRDNKVDFGKNKIMDYEDIIKLIKKAKRLGLRSVKFLGAGEPLEDKRFLEFLRELKKLSIIPLIFTKGHVMGDDNLVKRYYSQYGILTGKQLIKELKKVDASILLGFNSFDPKVQDKMVGGIKGYTLQRNKALELLVEAGFNKTNPTRLCLAINPITKVNYDEIFEIYKWARIRNLSTIICPTMVSGRCAKEKNWKKITPSQKKLIDLYTKIYKYNITKGIQTLKQIEEEGISAYAGTNVCNQVACGMYVTLTGIVLRCPGDDITIFGNVWKNSLKKIWVNSENYRRAGTYNCGCPPKMGKTFEFGFFSKVLSKLKPKECKIGKAPLNSAHDNWIG